MRVFICILALACGAVAARGQTFTGGPQRVTLLELYTSEGCSSCPPAEKAFAKLAESSRLWREVVPVAFHVTYFDSRSWSDPFASKEFTERQYAYARTWPQETVYTPCLVENGRESRRYDPAPTGETAGILTAECAAGGALRVRFTPNASARTKKFDVYVAQLEMGLSSKVRGGENSGRSLTHDFVARSLQRAVLTSDDTAELMLAKARTAATSPGHRRALAVWVTEHGRQHPLQAVGGWVE